MTRVIKENGKLTLVGQNGKQSLFSKARMKLTSQGKLIDRLNNSCEIILKDDEILFAPIDAFMTQYRNDEKTGRMQKVDDGNQDFGAEYIMSMVQDLGFKAERNVYYNSNPKYAIGVKLTNEQNLKIFKSVGQLLKFNRFSMKFRNLDKKSIEMITSELKQRMTR